MIQFKQEPFEEYSNINTKTSTFRDWMKSKLPDCGWSLQAGRVGRNPGIEPCSEMWEARA
jgi:hypothetical protein